MLAGLTVIPIIFVNAQPSDAENSFVKLREYVAARTAEFDQIPDERKTQLGKLAVYLRTRLAEKKPARLTFICTHNSRRSHLAQIWAAAAASHYGVENVTTYSGGTEATAFNPRAVATIERAGFQTEIAQPGPNPRYSIRFDGSATPVVCFSKEYDHETNPAHDFCAVMVCTQADKSCPMVPGSDERIALPYEDPKVADNTAAEAAQYDERCAQIGREMLFVFSKVSEKPAAQ
jgi:protein-tyrosine-phosphatase